mmetsp:Transcript_87564/g.138286  ORF Transcript_87564/g.138286 Transcript_87564/m.138286 type:complete len:142 (-) Transcript_87564:27-452(-)
MVAAQIKDTAQSNLAQSCVMTLRVVHTSRYGTPRQHKHACISRLVPVSSIGIQSSQPCMGSLLGHVSRPLPQRYRNPSQHSNHRCYFEIYHPERSHANFAFGGSLYPSYLAEVLESCIVGHARPDAGDDARVCNCVFATTS